VTVKLRFESAKQYSSRSADRLSKQLRLDDEQA
jgi:hypothetical protein